MVKLKEFVHKLKAKYKVIKLKLQIKKKGTAFENRKLQFVIEPRLAIGRKSIYHVTRVRLLVPLKDQGTVECRVPRANLL